MTKVIFLENLEDNKVGDIKNVADGYARNFLIPRGIVELATKSKMKELEGKLEKIKKEEVVNVKRAEEIAAKISKTKISITEEVNEEGALYGAVTAKEISEILKEKEFKIEPADIMIEDPIKELGEFEIGIKVGHGVETKVKISVERK